MSDAGDALATLMAQKRPAEVILIPVDWLPKDGRHWLFHADSSALALSWPLWAAGRAEEVLQEVRVPFRGLRPGERVMLRGGPIRAATDRPTAPSGATAPPPVRIPERVLDFVDRLDAMSTIGDKPVVCPTCGRSDPPAPNSRLTVNELGLLKRAPAKQRAPVVPAVKDSDEASFAFWMQYSAGLTANTIKGRLYVLNNLATYLGKPLLHATRPDLVRWQAAAVDGRAPATQEVYLAHVRAFFRWCLSERLIADDPSALLRAEVVQSA